VLVNNTPVREYFHEGRYFIEGRTNTEFKIKIKNNGATRIVAIPTVDGLSALNGQPGSLESPGYVIGPYSTMTIEGWRVSDEEVATFYFCDKNKSYSARVGKGGNQGVIGVAIYREKPSLFDFPPTFRTFTNITGPIYNHGVTASSVSHSAAAQASAQSYSLSCSAVDGVSQRSMDLGTGWGETKQSSVRSVDFEREDMSDAVFEIFYATKSKLKEMGVKVDSPTPSYISAFPGSYCPPPRN
jgi:hypothetical protein